MRSKSTARRMVQILIIAALSFSISYLMTSLSGSKSSLSGSKSTLPPLPKHQSNPLEAPFGTLLGIHSPSNVEVYSSNYKTLDPTQWENRTFFESKLDGIYCGFKWQCVELARRYLLVTNRLVFDSIPMAYDIFKLKCVRNVDTNEFVKLMSFKNGASTLPKVGSMLIWEPKGYFDPTGHVAILTAIHDDYVEIIEQNVEDSIWPPGQNYSRRLKRIGNTIYPTQDGVILGWLNVYPNEKFEYADYPNAKSSDLKRHKVTLTEEQMNNEGWLDKTQEYTPFFIQKNGGKVSSSPEAFYYTITESALEGLHYSTNELHNLFVHAAEYVINDNTGIKKYFGIPDKLWPKISKSWNTRRTDIVSGRFDFAITPNGIKVYEYNADSASCLLECGEIQNAWSEAAGLGEVGNNTSDNLFLQLKHSWWGKRIQGETLHILCDDDLEERYHALYMKAAAEAAGVKCKLIVGLDKFSWSEDGGIVDSDNVPITNVWKTWSWRTAFKQIKDSDELIYIVDLADYQQAFKKAGKPSSSPRLVDLLLHPTTRVFEPLWTVLPACKSILPVLSKLYPGHPYILKASFELTPELKKVGYAAKPITGRCGENVSIYDDNGKCLEQTDGKWDTDDNVYQELCMLPKFDGFHLQLNTWAVSGNFAGIVTRTDRSGIINLESSVDAIRVIKDN